MKNMMRLWHMVLAIAALVPFSSCVHEWPEMSNTVLLRLKVRHDLPWTEYEHVIGSGTRAASPGEWTARYTFHVYRKGETSRPVSRFSVDRDDLSMADFETEVPLPQGEWDIYCWQDLVGPGGEAFYDVSDFSRMTYLRPYRGDTDRRDVFEGNVSVEIPASIEENAIAAAEISLARPAARYVFIATDFRKFCNDALTRFDVPAGKGWDQLSPGQQESVLDGFAVEVRYPLYMPAVFDMFSRKVVDSWTGVTYKAVIQPLNSDEAVIALDYVFMNPGEGGAQVRLALLSPDGAATGLTSTLTVPLRHGQITYVRGNFLTASVGSGIGIDFSFSGDLNIKVE